MTKTSTKAKPRAPKSGAPKSEKKRSRRSQQRLIALRMGLENNGSIKAEDLREACRKVGVYNAPNFKQDMKKEAVLFNPVTKDGKTIAWKLTPVGRQIAKKATFGSTKPSKSPKPPKVSGGKPKKAVAKASAPKASAPKASAPKASAPKASAPKASAPTEKATTEKAPAEKATATPSF